jgi:hypothetical protein
MGNIVILHPLQLGLTPKLELTVVWAAGVLPFGIGHPLHLTSGSLSFVVGK